MTAGGWAFMILSWVAILALFGYCLYRTFRAKEMEPGDDSDDTAPR